MCKILSWHKQLFVTPVVNLMYLNPMLQEGCTYYPHSTVKHLLSIFPNNVIGTDVPGVNDPHFDGWVEGHRQSNGDLSHLVMVIDDFQDTLHLLERRL